MDPLRNDLDKFLGHFDEFCVKILSYLPHGGCLRMLRVLSSHYVGCKPKHSQEFCAMQTHFTMRIHNYN